MTQTVAINPYAGRSLRVVGMVLWIVATPFAAFTLLMLISMIGDSVFWTSPENFMPVFLLVVLPAGALIAGILMHRAGNARIRETQSRINHVSV